MFALIAKMTFGNLQEIDLVTGGIFVVSLAILTIWISKNVHRMRRAAACLMSE